MHTPNLSVNLMIPANHANIFAMMLKSVYQSTASFQTPFNSYSTLSGFSFLITNYFCGFVLRNGRVCEAVHPFFV